MKVFDRARFSRRSEKLGSAHDGDDQQAFVFEEIETGIAAIRHRSARVVSKRMTSVHRVGARALPDLERIETVIEPAELTEYAGKQKVLIGQDVSERLDVVPAKFRVIVTRRPRYAFKNADGVIQSPYARVAARQQGSVEIVADLYILWQKTLPRISGKSKLAEAIRYAVSRRAIFERFLTDGRVEIDSDIVERAITKYPWSKPRSIN